METQYKRKMNHSYMILYGKNQSPAYQLQMLQHNRPAGLLALDVVETKDMQQYWYDITGKQPLESVLSNSSLRIELLEQIFSELERVWTTLSRFLLQEERLLLSPNYIFLDSGNESVSFCYCPAADETESASLVTLLEYLLSKLDHTDAQAVKLGYDVYQGVVEENAGFREILHQARLHKNEPMAEPKRAERETDTEQEEEMYAIEENRKEPILDIPYQRENERVRYSNSQMLRRAEVDAVMQQTQNRMVLESRPEELSQKKEKKRRWFSFGRKKKGKNRESADGKASLLQKLRKEESEEILFEPTSCYVQEEERKTVFLGNRTQAQSAILHYEGSGNATDFCLDREEYLIGSRAEGVDGLVQDVAVSRIHARILHRPDGYYIEDLNSLNGTTVNGRLLDFKEQVKLTQGDEVCFANQKFEFSCG